MGVEGLFDVLQPDGDGSAVSLTRQGSRRLSTAIPFFMTSSEYYRTGGIVPIQSKKPTVKGSAKWFTGDVYVDSIARGQVRVGAVRFTPGSRTAWHAHAVVQTLYVTEGVGLVQSRGGDIEEIRPGDVTVTPADEWHWHGATPDHFMTHLSITERPGDERPEVQFGEHVTDQEYHAR